MVEYAALGSALLWAVSSVLARSQSRWIDAVSLNLVRTAAASLLTLGILVLSGRAAEPFQIPLPAVGLLLAGVLISTVAGDTLFYASMGLIGAARTLTISGIFPLFSVGIAAVLAGEPITLPVLAGSALIVVGVTLVATTRQPVAAKPEPVPAEHSGGPVRRGILFSILAAALWALGTVLLKLGSLEVDVLAANAIRLPTATAVLWLYRLILLPRRGVAPLPGPRRLAEVAAIGVLGSGVGSWLYVLSAQTVGAGRTASLGATAPLFAAPLAAIFLKEPLGPRVISGTLLSVGGVWLLV